MRKLIEELYSLIGEGLDDRHYKFASEENLSDEEYYAVEMLVALNPGGRKDAISRYGLSAEALKQVQEALAKKGYAKINKAGAVAATAKAKELHEKGRKLGQFTFYEPPKALLK
jgi:hypothetical protein